MLLKINWVKKCLSFVIDGKDLGEAFFIDNLNHGDWYFVGKICGKNNSIELENMVPLEEIYPHRY